MTQAVGRATLVADLRALGLRGGETVMVHSSLRAIGATGPEEVVAALLEALGAGGTLLMPALSYAQTPPLVHDTRTTPVCVGYLPEYFRTRPGTLRSLHPTHSVCAAGARARELTEAHARDRTPCGEGSPFSRILHEGGSILMLGCGLRPNTAMHAVEEHARPPYLFGPPVVYRITDAAGATRDVAYTPHDFAGVEQRYDRVADILGPPQLAAGRVGRAPSFLIDAGALFERALARLREDPLAFVEPAPLTAQG